MTVQATVRVGDVSATPIVESVLWSAPEIWIGGQDVEAAIAATREWAEVSVGDDGAVVVPVRSYIVESQGQTIVVDTGQGEHSPYGTVLPQFRPELGDYLGDLEAAGVERASVVAVALTHAHPDHIGGNTQLIDGVWEPTFPNARYLLPEPDWDLVELFGALAEGPLTSLEERGVLDLVSADHVLTDEVRLVASHGHTPGHVCVEIESGGERAVILGDVVHHKLSLGDPTGREAEDSDEALTTRQAWYERLATSDVLVFATHFEEPAIGYFERAGEGYRFVEER
jgi:glyoxylase-like metal-dependent hydrolase (beta-lactamase superfamily II)